MKSNIFQVLHDNAAQRILDSYSNRKPEDAAFLKYLMESHESNPNYTFFGTMTQMENSGSEWHGETGFISKTMHQKHMDELK